VGELLRKRMMQPSTLAPKGPVRAQKCFDCQLDLTSPGFYAWCETVSTLVLNRFYVAGDSPRQPHTYSVGKVQFDYNTKRRQAQFPSPLKRESTLAPKFYGSQREHQAKQARPTQPRPLT